MPIIEGGLNIRFPRMIKVRQKFDSYKVEDIHSIICEQMSQKNIRKKIKPGMSIAIGVGSRGISNLFEIVQGVIDEIRKYGANPFVVPAMGSHGCATSEGQKEVLASYGITEKTLKVPIKSSMNVVQVGQNCEGIPVYFDEIAFYSDGIIPINRVKIHTDFRGEVESGLLKMLVIGFGNHKGASTIHSFGLKNFCYLIPEIGSIIIKKTPILFGIACIEDAFEEIAEIKVLLPNEFYPQEKEMLKKSKKIMARIKIPLIDVLIIDEIGKNISGDCLDPNIVGRFSDKQNNDVEAPQVKVIVVLRLTKESLGNANGIGYADITVKELFDKINFSATYVNAFTSGVLDVAKIPIVMDTDKEAIALGIKITNITNTSNARVVRIKNTLNIHEIMVSESIYQEIKDKRDFEVIGSFKKMEFNESGVII